MSATHDIVVVGGGLVGATFACAMAGSGRRIALVEAVPFEAPNQPSFDERTTAIGWGTRRLFEAWGLWSRMAAEAAAIRRLHVSQRGRFGAVRVDRDDYGVEALGYVVPNRVLGRVLLDRLAVLDDVELLAPMRFRDLECRPDAVSVTASDADDRRHRLRARLVVASSSA